jgi:hypothetical protein
MLKERKMGKYDHNGNRRISIVCWDTRVLLMIGAAIRVYWSHSPPQVWSHEPLWLQVLAILDVHLAPVACGMFLYHGKGMHHIDVPWYHSWKFLCVIAGIMSFLPLYKRDTAPNAWPLADCTMVFNMAIEGLAILPELLVIEKTEDALAPEVSHFVGMLSSARVCRIMFWVTLCVLEGFYIVISSHLICYILPDLLHTLFMGDFLIAYLKKMKQDRLDGLIGRMHEEMLLKQREYNMV